MRPVIITLAIILCILIALPLVNATVAPITQAKYNALATGMTLEQVNKHIGFTGKQVTDHSFESPLINIDVKSYEWERGGKKIVVIFTNGKATGRHYVDNT